MIALTACGGGGSSTASSSSSSSSGGADYVVVNGVKYTCGDSTKMATHCTAFNTSGEVLVQPAGATITSGAVGWSDESQGFMFFGFPNGDRIGWASSYPNGLGVIYNNSSSEGVGFDGVGSNGWYLNYWWEEFNGGFIVGW
ncbi:MAG: hypothetical protein HZB29_08755 [Nitrospinae bacterium]|nr:hypothetical protein [Nitrospinota bacterium]